MCVTVECELLPRLLKPPNYHNTAEDTTLLLPGELRPGVLHTKVTIMAVS